MDSRHTDTVSGCCKTSRSRPIVCIHLSLSLLRSLFLSTLLPFSLVFSPKKCNPPSPLLPILSSLLCSPPSWCTELSLCAWPSAGQPVQLEILNLWEGEEVISGRVLEVRGL